MARTFSSTSLCVCVCVCVCVCLCTLAMHMHLHTRNTTASVLIAGWTLTLSTSNIYLRQRFLRRNCEYLFVESLSVLFVFVSYTHTHPPPPPHRQYTHTHTHTSVYKYYLGQCLLRCNCEDLFVDGPQRSQLDHTDRFLFFGLRVNPFLCLCTLTI